MLSSYDSLKKHNQEEKQNIFYFGTTVRRICESVPVSRVILRFLRISQEISQVDSTCENIDADQERAL